MTRPLSNDMRTRIIRELVEQAPEPTEQWHTASDSELNEALNQHRQRKVSALATAYDEGTRVSRVREIQRIKAWLRTLPMDQRQLVLDELVATTLRTLEV